MLKLPLLVLNKYFPPDFDPSLIPRRKVPKNSQQVVRLMAPFSMYVLANMLSTTVFLTFTQLGGVILAESIFIRERNSTLVSRQ